MSLRRARLLRVTDLELNLICVRRWLFRWFQVLAAVAAVVALVRACPLRGPAHYGCISSCFFRSSRRAPAFARIARVPLLDVLVEMGQLVPLLLLWLQMVPYFVMALLALFPMCVPSCLLLSLRFLRVPFVRRSWGWRLHLRLALLLIFLLVHTLLQQLWCKLAIMATVLQVRL